jgi:pyridoxal phosphate enzyme (YggS family)
LSVRENLTLIRDRIASACARVGRAPSEVTLIAVSKTFTLARIQEAIECGVRTMGENRVQEAAAKIEAFRQAGDAPKLEWHLIGHLQSNKARRAVELFDAIHSIDSLKLAERTAQVAGELGRRLPIFIEVNLGGEESKHGATPAETLRLIEQVGKLESLELRGLMAVPPFLETSEDVRPYFQQLRRLRDQALSLGLIDAGFRDLSMGMSGDFEIAIEEGSTFVRIGTAIFGDRTLTTPGGSTPAQPL